MAEVVTWNDKEANMEKKPKTYNDFQYDTQTDGGCLTKLNEINQLIKTIEDDVENIGNNYTKLQALYNNFTDFNDVMNYNTMTLKNSTANIADAYLEIVNGLQLQVEKLEQSSGELMEDIGSINQLVSSGGSSAVDYSSYGFGAILGNDIGNIPSNVYAPPSPSDNPVNVYAPPSPSDNPVNVYAPPSPSDYPVNVYAPPSPSDNTIELEPIDLDDYEPIELEPLNPKDYDPIELEPVSPFIELEDIKPDMPVVVYAPPRDIKLEEDPPEPIMFVYAAPDPSDLPVNVYAPPNPSDLPVDVYAPPRGIDLPVDVYAPPRAIDLPVDVYAPPRPVNLVSEVYAAPKTTDEDK